MRGRGPGNRIRFSTQPIRFHLINATTTTTTTTNINNNNKIITMTIMITTTTTTTTATTKTTTTTRSFQAKSIVVKSNEVIFKKFFKLW